MITEKIFDHNGIKLEESNGSIYCYFPKRLKDEFCSTFPSAKWSGFCWIVTTRVKKRALSWAEHAAEAAKKALELEELEMQEADLDRLNRLAAGLQKEIENRRREIIEEKRVIEQIAAAKEKEKALREMLNAENDKLSELRQQRAEEQRELDQQRREIDELLSQVIDLPKLKGVVLSTFAKYHQQVGATAHDMFKQAQAEFREAREKLREAGYRLAAIEYLCEANFNRPDRDAVKFMPRDAWYDLSPMP